MLDKVQNRKGNVKKITETVIVMDFVFKFRKLTDDGTIDC